MSCNWSCKKDLHLHKPSNGGKSLNREAEAGEADKGIQLYRFLRGTNNRPWWAPGLRWRSRNEVPIWVPKWVVTGAEGHYRTVESWRGKFRLDLVKFQLCFLPAFCHLLHNLCHLKATSCIVLSLFCEYLDMIWVSYKDLLIGELYHLTEDPDPPFLGIIWCPAQCLAKTNPVIRSSKKAGIRILGGKLGGGDKTVISLLHFRSTCSQHGGQNKVSCSFISCSHFYVSVLKFDVQKLTGGVGQSI